MAYIYEIGGCVNLPDLGQNHGRQIGLHKESLGLGSADIAEEIIKYFSQDQMDKNNWYLKLQKLYYISNRRQNFPLCQKQCVGSVRR